MIPGTTMRSRKPSLPSPRPSRNRGSVLAVVLVVLVVMMLGGVSLLRSVDTSALLSGNLAFKRDSVNRTSIGLNEAFKVMQTLDFLEYQANNAGCDPVTRAAGRPSSSTRSCRPCRSPTATAAPPQSPVAAWHRPGASPSR